MREVARRTDAEVACAPGGADDEERPVRRRSHVVLDGHRPRLGRRDPIHVRHGEPVGLPRSRERVAREERVEPAGAEGSLPGAVDVVLARSSARHLSGDSVGKGPAP